MSIEKTGVFATKNEISLCRRLAAEEKSSPVVKVMGKWLPEVAHGALMATIDELAQKHGLPPPPQTNKIDKDGDVTDGIDHYGLLATGEFTRQKHE